MRSTVKQWRTVACLFVAMLTLLTSAARASVTLRFAVDQPHYAVTPGGSVDVVVKLVEERESAGDPSVILAGGGLIGFDLAVTRQSGTSLITNASVNTGQFSLLLLGGHSPDPLPAVGSTIVELYVSALDNPGPTGTQEELLRELELGTVTITAPIGQQMSTFTVTDSVTFGSNTVTNLGIALDAQIIGTTFTVHVPEPMWFVLASASAGLIVRRPRRVKAG